MFANVFILCNHSNFQRVGGGGGGGSGPGGGVFTLHSEQSIRFHFEDPNEPMN
jgi:hypothetical protein